MILTLSASCSRIAEKKEGAVQSAPVKVSCVVAGPSDNLTRNVHVGEVIPDKAATVGSSNAGTVSILNVEKGSRVRKGQVLAVVESQMVKSSYDIALSNLRQAEDAYDRVKKVFDKGGISQLQMMDIQTKLDKARASAEASAKAVEDCKVKAPYDGIVSEVLVDKGVEIAPGQGIVRIMDNSKHKIRISVHENDINSINIGDSARVEIPALGLQDIPVLVCEKNISTDRLSHSYDCFLRIKSEPSGIMPGMAIKATFCRLDTSQALVIPASAVQMDREGKYVWVNDGGRVRKVRISIGSYAGKGVVVDSGLSSGDKVIYEGYQKVSTGMKVVE